MKVVVLQQGSQEWLDWRLGGLGSSDAMVIAAAHGMIEKRSWMRSLDDLFTHKMSGVDAVTVNDRMRRGTEYEPEARRAFEAKTGIVVQPVCAEMDTRREIRASFDGITLDRLQTNEIKCPNEKVYELARQDEIVDYYRPQVVHQALVAWDVPEQWPDEAVINFFAYVPETKEGALVKVRAVEFREFGKELYEHELAFLELLKTGVPPCGAEYASLADRYLCLEREIQRLTKAQGSYKDALLRIAKERDNSMEGGGVSVIKTERAGTVDWKRLASEYSIGEAEIAKYRKRGSEVWQVRTDPNAEPNITSQAVERTDADHQVASLGDDFWSHLSKQTFVPRATHVRPAVPAEGALS